MPSLDQQSTPRLTAEEKRAIAELIARAAARLQLARRVLFERAGVSRRARRIWRRGWLFVGHTCEIRNPGDYFTFAVDDDSLIVIRDDDGQIHALWNVCRHRGTQICDQPQGRVGRLVCPYHQWTYARDGSLVSCRGMQEESTRASSACCTRHVRELAGLIYVSLCRRSARLRRGGRSDRPVGPAAGLQPRQGGEDRRLRRGRQLEARLGKQPRVLPLQRQPSAVHQGQLRPLQRRRRQRARSNRGSISAVARSEAKMGRRRAWRSATAAAA